MSKVEVNQVTQQCGTTLTVGGGACKTAVVDATTVTLGRCGGTVSLASGATQSGFGRTGTVDWDTASIKSTGFTAVSGNGYFCNTSGGAFTATFPASPTAGDIVAISDYTRTFQTNNLTIGRNSKPIGGVADDAILTKEGQSATFVFVDDTEGWININETQTSQTGMPPYVAASGGDTTITCGDYKTHIFTGPGTFCVSNAGAPGGSNSVEHLTVAGGGGGGAGSGGAGAGAGGYRTTYPSPATAGTPVSVQGYPITVGAAGAGATSWTARGVSGSNSTGVGITSAGGGGGGSENGCASEGYGANGGSAGGGSWKCSSPGGTGNTPPVSPPQGTNGGQGGGSYSGGGGGGATVAGANQSAAGGAGGTGGPIADAYFGPTAPSYGTPGPAGSTRYFAGGGGGGSQSPNSGAGVGGAGGGGAGGMYPAAGVVGTTNTGGGGGGDGNTSSAGNGGSGFVAIRYKFQ